MKLMETQVRYSVGLFSGINAGPSMLSLVNNGGSTMAKPKGNKLFDFSWRHFRILASDLFRLRLSREQLFDGSLSRTPPSLAANPRPHQDCSENNCNSPFLTQSAAMLRRRLEAGFIECTRRPVSAQAFRRSLSGRFASRTSAAVMRSAARLRQLTLAQTDADGHGAEI